MAKVIILDNCGYEDLREDKSYTLYDGDRDMWQEYIIDDSGRKIDIDELSRKCRWSRV